jgi:nucleotide-binding universal stress UspA family protein
MRALVWITEESWEATVAEAGAHLSPGAEITLLHVADAEPEAVVDAARHALLGRAHGGPAVSGDPLPAITDAAAEDLLAEAAGRLGRPAKLEARRGRIEREVLAAADGMDLLILARGGERDQLGPRSLGAPTRFVVDHAPCSVLLIWPLGAPGPESMPAAPEKPPPAPAG